MNHRAKGSAMAALMIGAFCACQSSNQENATAHAAGGQSNGSACSKAVVSASDINAFLLFEGAVSCSQEGRQDDTNFLMILGQIRATADMTILTPLNDENAERASALYAQLFYHFGGLGFDEFYRTPTNVSELVERIRNTDLPFTNDYDPGWAYLSSSKTDIYSDVISYARERRIWQMRSMALKLQDDEYYKADQAFTELQRSNPLLQQGTPAAEEATRLMEQMRDAARDIPELPEPEDTIPYARLNEQDPELSQRHVATGFNGPASQGTYVFRSAAEVRQSWLAAALSDQEVEALVAGTDFSTQVLVGLSFGRRMNASGQIIISRLGYHESSLGYNIDTRIGVVPESCGFSFTESYPFVVGVTAAVPDAEVRGFGMSNFPDECGPIVSGKPVTQR